MFTTALSAMHAGKYLAIVTAVVVCLLVLQTAYLFNFSHKRYQIGATPGCEGTPLVASAERQTNFQEDCSIRRFKSELRLDLDPPVIPVHLLAKCQVVVYNRVPKCGSRTLDAILKTMAEQHGYYQIKKHKTFAVSYNTWKNAIPSLKKANKTFVLTSHHYFTPFKEWYNDSAIYINLIRDPVDWFISSFSWNKFDNIKSPFFMPKDYYTRSLEECVEDPDCFNWLPLNWGPIRYMCGNDKECTSYRSALGRTLTNLQDEYLVIGVTEELEKFTEVLEFLLPHLFQNMTTVYRNEEIASRRKYKAKKKKVPTATLR